LYKGHIDGSFANINHLKEIVFYDCDWLRFVRHEPRPPHTSEIHKLPELVFSVAAGVFTGRLDPGIIFYQRISAKVKGLTAYG